MATITQDFTTPSEHVYDADKISVGPVLAQLANQRPDGATAGAVYDTDYNLETWSLGTVTGTPTGTVSQETDSVRLDGGYLDHAATLNVADRQRGCLRCMIQPRWAGEGQAYDVKLFSIFGDTGQKIELVIYRNTVTPRVIYTGDTGDTGFSFSPWPDYTWAQWYTLEWNWDFLNGEHRIFIDGVKVGATRTNIDTFSDTLETLRLGSDAAGTTGQSKMYVKNMILYDSPQHTTDDSFDPAYTVPATKYVTDNPTIKPNVKIYTNGVNSWEFTASQPAGTGVTGIVTKNGLKLYWNGATWAPSDGTYAQSSALADISANVDTMDGEGDECGAIFFLHSDDGETTPTITDMAVDFEYLGENPDDIHLTRIWCDTVPFDLPDDGTIEVFLSRDAVRYKTAYILRRIATPTGRHKTGAKITPDDDGYWYVDLIDTDNMDGTVYYYWKFGTTWYRSLLPEINGVNFWSLSGLTRLREAPDVS